MKIAVASGKGGTGKTTVAVSLALSAPGAVTLLDCDVEEPNAGLFLGRENAAEKPVTVPVPQIDHDRCTACGKCGSFCEYNAIVCIGTSVMVFPELCHSCGGCALVCPEKAITEVPVEIGTLAEWSNGTLHFVEGILKIGNALSPPVIRAVKASVRGEGLVIIDCPPGTSCPMVTAVTGADYVILVTEPTPFGLHDLDLAVKTVRKMDLDFGVIINRSDSGDDRVVEYCAREKIPVLLQIPEDRKIAAGYSTGKPLVESVPRYKEKFARVLAGIFREDTAALPVEQTVKTKEIVFISGKGGTGKTSLTAAIASLATMHHRAVFADCDVDAADLHLVLDPEIRERHDFVSGNVARIDHRKCISSGTSGICVDNCRFGAIGYSDLHGYKVDEGACEGCGVCVRLCPASAISFPERYCGEWYVSDTRFGTLVHAALDTRAENSGKLVTLVRKEAKRVAGEISAEGPVDYIIVDGSPGTGCPVIASITGADAVVAVTEPTLSGRHDLERVAGLAKHFGVPVLVCVNKFDINAGIADEIEQWCGRNGISFIGKIPYDRAVTAAQIQGKTIIEYADAHNVSAATTEAIQNIWERIGQLTQ